MGLVRWWNTSMKLADVGRATVHEQLRIALAFFAHTPSPPNSFITLQALIQMSVCCPHKSLSAYCFSSSSLPDPVNIWVSVYFSPDDIVAFSQTESHVIISCPYPASTTREPQLWWQYLTREKYLKHENWEREFPYKGEGAGWRDRARGKEEGS